MLTIEFEIGGKRVSIKKVKNAREREILLAAYSNIVARLAEVKCPVHGEAPRVLAQGDNAKSLTIEVSGCCDKLVEEAEGRLGE